METIRTGPSIFKAMEKAVAPLASSLKIIEHNTSSMSPEQRLEDTLANKKAEKIENQQSSLLESIAKNTKHKEEKKGFLSKLLDFFKNNWGKILLGAGILQLPLSWWKTLYSGFKTFWNQPWWAILAEAVGTIAAGGWLLGKGIGAAARSFFPVSNIGTPAGKPPAGKPPGKSGGTKPKTPIGFGKESLKTNIPDPPKKPGWMGKFKKAIQAVRKSKFLLPILGMGGAAAAGGGGSAIMTALALASIAETGLELGKAIKINFMNPEKEGETFYNKFMGTLDDWVTGMAQFGEKELIKRGTTKEVFEKLGESILNASSKITLSVVSMLDTTAKAYENIKNRTKELVDKIKNADYTNKITGPTTNQQIKEEENKIKKELKDKNPELLRGGGAKSGDVTYSMPERPGYFSHLWSAIKKPFMGKKTASYKPRGSEDALFRASRIGLPINTGAPLPAPKEQHVGGALTPLARIIMNDKRNNLSGWRGLTDRTKGNVQALANMFGGLELTSGHRSNAKQIEAMIAKGGKGLRVYKKRWRDLLSEEELDSKPNSDTRRLAVAKLINAGLSSQHSHGNAVDFSIPPGYIGQFPLLKKQIEKAFPGSKLIEESDHLHLAFANATDRVDQKMAGMNQLYGERMVAQAAPPSFNVVTQNQVSNANDNTSIVMTPGQVRGKPIPGDISFTQFMMS